MDPDLICLQETWKEIESTKKYTYINKCREDRRGGGVSIGIKCPFIARNISERLPPSLISEEILLVQAVIEESEIFIFNIYISNF